MTHPITGRSLALVALLYLIGGGLAGNSVAQQSPVLTVSSMPFSFASSGGEADIEVTNGGGGTLSWAAETDQSWVAVVSGASGVNTGTIKIVVAGNLSTSPRAAVLRVTANATGSPVNISISQNGTLRSSTITTAITLPFSGIGGAANYRLVGLPGNLGIPLDEVLPGIPRVDWTAYRDAGGEPYAPLAFDGSAAFQFGPGRGFWVLSNKPLSITHTAPTVDLDATGAFAIPVHPGWNIISNPFDEDVQWEDVLEANNLLQRPLYRWAGQYETATVFRSAKSAEAYYFENREEVSVLRIPYGERVAGKNTATVQPAWILTAFADGKPAGQVRGGTAPGSERGFDRYDQRAPPGYFQETALFLDIDSAPGGGRYLIEEYRPSEIESGQTYALVLTNTSGTPVALEIDENAALRAQAAVVVDVETGRTFDIRKGELAGFQSTRKRHSLALIMGTEAFVAAAAQQVQPATATLMQNYPNPVQSGTTIPYALHEAGLVKLAVYDLLGREVATLVDEVKEAGYYEAVLNAAGMTSGLYVYRLTTGLHTLTGQFVVLGP